MADELIRECCEKHLSVKQLEARIDQTNRAHTQQSRLSPVIRDNRLIINAVLDTVKELNRIGINVDSRVEERDGSIEVIVRIPSRTAN